jgi:cytidine deaminase
MVKKANPALSAKSLKSKPNQSDELVAAAWGVRDRAVAPYSGFKVGAALLASNDRIFTGCNIENSTYGLTICAERVAVFKALSEGAGSFTKIAIVTGSSKLTPPCGSCRQILWEFCGDIEILMANLEGQHRQVRLHKLFPEPFERSFFRSNAK